VRIAGKSGWRTWCELRIAEESSLSSAVLTRVESLTVGRVEIGKSSGGELENFGCRNILGGKCLINAVAETWRRVWGDGKFFRGPRFLNEVFFREKCPFSRQKFLMTFLVFDHIFRNFPFFFQISVSLLC